MVHWPRYARRRAHPKGPFAGAALQTGRRNVGAAGQPPEWAPLPVLKCEMASVCFVYPVCLLCFRLLCNACMDLTHDGMLSPSCVNHRSGSACDWLTDASMLWCCQSSQPRRARRAAPLPHVLTANLCEGGMSAPGALDHLFVSAPCCAGVQQACAEAGGQLGAPATRGWAPERAAPGWAAPRAAARPHRLRSRCRAGAPARSPWPPRARAPRPWPAPRWPSARAAPPAASRRAAPSRAPAAKLRTRDQGPWPAPGCS